MNRILYIMGFFFSISAGILGYVFPRTLETTVPVMTTIGQFSEEIAALADKTPTGLIYTAVSYTHLTLPTKA